MNYELTEKVKRGISDYLEFDVQEIFDVSDFITIYGGAVRDSLAGMSINDIDILCMSDSAKMLTNFLITEKDYRTIELYDIDAMAMYKDISLISEPITLIKGEKIIQIIRPSYAIKYTKRTSDIFYTHKIIKDDAIESYKKSYIDLIKNVDISCCGVFLYNENNNLRLMEACENGIIHCLNKYYVINKISKLYSENRTFKREMKLVGKGWTNIEEPNEYFFEKTDKNELNQYIRKIKMDKLNIKTEYYYKIK
jgi:hypothetical protein